MSELSSLINCTVAVFLLTGELNLILFFSASRIPDVGYNFETNKGKPFHYFSYGVACSEVEIDCLTGDHKVRGSAGK